MGNDYFISLEDSPLHGSSQCLFLLKDYIRVIMKTALSKDPNITLVHANFFITTSHRFWSDCGHCLAYFLLMSQLMDSSRAILIKRVKETPTEQFGRRNSFYSLCKLKKNRRVKVQWGILVSEASTLLNAVWRRIFPCPFTTISLLLKRVLYTMQRDVIPFHNHNGNNNVHDFITNIQRNQWTYFDSLF